MKKLHLLCNAHLDPVWLWRRNEGLAEAISTFRVAAEFCETYDGFVFNHNEALIYEWVEEYEPQLFKRIQKLVKEKKWVIMGGWYLQPDCVMTSGESLMEQIRLGQEYFKEKFGVVPTTAINFDPFGHSRGLVQILKKSGYEGYLFMRPFHFKGDFIWEGYDGSQILAHGMKFSYGSLKGHALPKIKEYIKTTQDKEVGLCLWGVGNHGGGPSRIDLEAINDFMASSETQILHSSADAYMAEVDKSDLPVRKESLIPCMVGCYTSMVQIKQANRRLENKLLLTEKIMSYAQMTTDFSFEEDCLLKAKKALAFCQFHDILPGTSIKPVETDCLRTLSYGEEIADEWYNKAFFKLCEGQPKAKDGEIPVLIFNPHPYEIEGEFEIGFMLQNQNWNEDEQTLAVVYDATDNPLPTQNEKPNATFNLDWIEKVSFTGKLAPSSISRFDCKLTTVKKDTLPVFVYEDDHIAVTNDRMKVRISRKTGLIDLYEVDGRSYIQNSGVLEVYKDNEDPWGMRVDSFRDYEGSFQLMSDAEVNQFIGYPEKKTPNVRVVEHGDVRLKIQAFFSYNRSTAVVQYTIPKTGTYLDVDITLYSNEPNRMLKYKIDTNLAGTPYGETAFGAEPLYDDEREAVYHKWCGIKESQDALYVINRGIYGGSFTGNTIKLSLLRTPVYSAHPIEERQIAPHDRFLEHVDMGERQFSFRITTEKNPARQAQIYNEAPPALSFFPSGEGQMGGSVVTIDHPEILLSSIRKHKDGFRMTFYNAADHENHGEITLVPLGKKISLDFKQYELQTIDL